MINVITHSLGQHIHGEGSLHRVLNLPTRSESSNGSWDPLRELYAIEGEATRTEEVLKRQEDEEAHRLQQAAMAVVDAERLRREEDDHRNLLQRGRRVHEEILQTKMGDQNIFATSQQNILVAKALCDTIEPMLT